MNTAQLIQGDCLEVLPMLPPESIDSLLTDPPYGLGFMGHEWDHGVPGAPFWRETLRVAKPGAFLLAFGGTRTFHRLASAIEDAGWQIRDCLMWLYGSGFPKSHDISKAIDKAAGAERAMVRTPMPKTGNFAGGFGGSRPWIDTAMAVGYHEHPGDEPVTDDAKTWQDYGTALKPAYEPIVVAMKPLDGTFVANALRHGVAGLNINGCRVGDEPRFNPPTTKGATPSMGSFAMCHGQGSHVAGRWPANVMHDGSAEATAGMGHAARYFYCPKASKSERDGHPTTKPLALMEYLCRLTKTPSGGKVLDPFLGSGSTGVAALRTGRHFIGIERDPEYFQIAKRRIEAAQIGEIPAETSRS